MNQTHGRCSPMCPDMRALLIILVLTFLAWRGVLRAEVAVPICFDAEDSTSLQGPMRVIKLKAKPEKRRGQVSGDDFGAFVEVPWTEETRKKNAPKGMAVYKINVDVTATYYLWARTYWIHNCGNSIAVAFDDRPQKVLGQDSVYGRWHWVPKPVKFKLAVGEHCLRLIGREPGVRIDQFYLSSDPDYVPQRIRKVTVRIKHSNGP